MNKLIEDYFASIEFKLDNTSLVVSRTDGIPIFSINNISKNVDINTFSALSAASIQASEALMQMMPNDDKEAFRFSFDTSASGIYIMRVQNDIEPLIMSLFYYDQENPGKLKNKLRLIKSGLEEHIEINQEQMHVTPFLFDDISDEEMDGLFNGVMA